MKLLDRYIGTYVLGACLLVLSVMVSLDLIASLVDEAGDIDERYTFTDALLYVGLTLPGSVYEYLPFAALVGSLAGLGVLANNSELVVVRAAGVSVSRLLWSTLRPVLVLVAISLVLSEFVVPWSTQQAEVTKAEARQKSLRKYSQDGIWHREGSRFMYFSRIRPGGVIEGFSEYTLDHNFALVRTRYAERAVYVGTTTGEIGDSGWELEKVSEVIIDEKAAKHRWSPRDSWRTSMTPQVLPVLVLAPSDMSISGLWAYTKYSLLEGKSVPEHTLALWTKLLQPLAIVALVTVAISFIFGSLRSVSMGYRIFLGVMVGIAFRTAQDMLGPASLVYGFAPILALLIPTGICFAVGIVMMRRA